MHDSYEAGRKPTPVFAAIPPVYLVDPVARAKRDRRLAALPCEGSGRRTTPTGSSSFPEVKCPCCHYYASPVKKYGEYQIRSHRAVKTDPYADDDA